MVVPFFGLRGLWLRLPGDGRGHTQGDPHHSGNTCTCAGALHSTHSCLYTYVYPWQACPHNIHMRRNAATRVLMLTPSHGACTHLHTHVHMPQSCPHIHTYVHTHAQGCTPSYSGVTVHYLASVQAHTTGMPICTYKCTHTPKHIVPSDVCPHCRYAPPTHSQVLVHIFAHIHAPLIHVHTHTHVQFCATHTVPGPGLWKWIGPE